MRVRRSMFQIIAAILESARNGIKLTPLMYKAYLSYHQLNDVYLPMLKSAGLIIEKEDSGGRSFKPTEKGIKFLKLFKPLDEMVKR